jgi:hypothetical protein
LTKSEIRLHIHVGRIYFPLACKRAEDEKPWLFETLAYNLPREPGRGSDFLNSLARNPLKRLDSKK